MIHPKELLRDEIELREFLEIDDYPDPTSLPNMYDILWESQDYLWAQIVLEKMEDAENNG